ncbi:hypothetical protein MNB_SV-6-602 [hydrothermal vent metagenome]|uniref:Uncharacterized protein n=1 Tax=hydrothermal vent metagenome TaxID=652676 RepID=A0A1W1CC93_9ZZZZ
MADTQKDATLSEGSGESQEQIHDESGETIETLQDDKQETAQDDKKDSSIKSANEPTIRKGWYVRLVVESEHLTDSGSILGYLEGASDGKDRYSSKALKSSGLYLAISDSRYSADSEYRSDYRAFKPLGSKQEVWYLIVSNSKDRDGDVTISWDGITFVEQENSDLFKENHKDTSAQLALMRLVDVDNKKIVKISEDSNYTFNMGGKSTKRLKLIMLANGDEEPEVEQ